MASKSSWRLKFIDIDSSFSISTEAGTIKGYMVVRAPKGETEPYYFEKGNQAAIEAYVGLGGSDYPDIQEAIAFNREYGIYISAPAGASDEYPSYIGGAYLTTEGLINLYNVPSKDQIDYTKKLGLEGLDGATAKMIPRPNPYGSDDPEDKSVIGTVDTYAILIEKIPAEKWNDLKEIAINYSGDSKNGQKAGTYFYQINKNNYRLYCEDEEGEAIEDIHTGIWGKSADGANYFVIIGGGKWLASASESLPSEKEASNSMEALNGYSFKKDNEVWIFNGKQVTISKNNGEPIQLKTATLSSDNLTVTLDESIAEGAEGGKFTLSSTGYKLVGQKPTVLSEETGEEVTIQLIPTDETKEILGVGTSLSKIFEVISSDPALSTLIKNETSANEAGNTNIPYFTLNNLAPTLENVVYDSDNYKYSGSSSGLPADAITKYILGGCVNAPWNGEKSIHDGVTTNLKDFDDQSSSLSYLIDIKNKTFATIIQKSPTETTTQIKLTQVGYDKWLYDYAFPEFSIDAEEEDLQVSFKDIASEGYEYFISGINKDFSKFSDERKRSDLRIWHYDGATAEFKDVTKDFVTQDILVSKTFTVNPLYDGEENKDHFIESSKGIAHKILLVEGASSLTIEQDREGLNTSAPFLKKDINFNTFSFSVAEEVYSAVNLTSGGSFHGSMDEKGTDSYGGNIYWPNVLNENDFSFVEVIPNYTFDAKQMGDTIDANGIFTGTKIIENGKEAQIPIHGQRFTKHLVDLNHDEGKIGSAWRDEMMAICDEGWKEAYDTNYDDVYVFMEPTGQNKLKEQLASLVEGTHKLAVAIAPLPMTKAQAANPATVVVPVKNKQVAVYAGEFMQYDSRTGKNYYTCPIGDIGKMCCRIIDKKMGGWAPAWYNYNSMGGQLDRAVLKAKYNFSDSATEVMDKKGINPIVYNADDGLMIVSSKTTQDPNNLTDWSFLEHVLAFCLVKREIRDNVMRPQIEKPIDDFWMNVRQTQVDAILDKRISGPNKIWTAATCDIAGVNTDVTKAQRKFCIYVKVKVTPFAQTVELTLENVAQTTQL